MSISVKARSAYVSLLAASIVIVAAAVPAGTSFARGSGAGHAAMSPHAMRTASAQGGRSPRSGAPQAGEHRQHQRDHRHPASPPSVGTTTTTTDGTTPATPPNITTNTSASSSASATAAPSSSTTTTTTTNQTQPTDTTFSTGGTLAADQRPGGGGDTLAACMSYWKQDTDMTKVEWRDTCKRTLNGLDLGGGVTDNPAITASRAHRPTRTTSLHRAAAQHRGIE